MSKETHRAREPKKSTALARAELRLFRAMVAETLKDKPFAPRGDINEVRQAYARIAPNGTFQSSPHVLDYYFKTNAVLFNIDEHSLKVGSSSSRQLNEIGSHLAGLLKSVSDLDYTFGSELEFYAHSAREGGRVGGLSPNFAGIPILEIVQLFGGRDGDVLAVDMIKALLKSLDRVFGFIRSRHAAETRPDVRGNLRAKTLLVKSCYETLEATGGKEALGNVTAVINQPFADFVIRTFEFAVGENRPAEGRDDFTRAIKTVLRDRN